MKIEIIQVSRSSLCDQIQSECVYRVVGCVLIAPTKRDGGPPTGLEIELTLFPKLQ